MPDSTVEPGCQELEQIRLLRIQPGDTVVGTVRRSASPEEFARVRHQLKERFPDNEVLILSEGLELSVTR